MDIPLRYDDQDIKSQFDLILSAVFSVNGDSSEEEIRALNERIQREVTAKPILARIMKGNASLLSYVCINLDGKRFHPAIKFLILANPSALLWETDINYIGERTIHNIAGHSTHCVLMPWIATNYQWVLDNELCLEDPPLFYLLEQYARRRDETGCTAAIVQRFFEAYPQGLTQEDSNECTPLHAIVMGSAECEPDLFMWMAEQCPSNILKTDNTEWTPLHYACNSLTCREETDDSKSEICKYIIAKCPESARILEMDSHLPIHILLLISHCQHRPVKEVVMCLLREYPESYDVAAPNDTGDLVPSSIPFIQRIKSLLDEERELKETIDYLREVSTVFQDAVEGTDNPSSLASSTCD